MRCRGHLPHHPDGLGKDRSLFLGKLKEVALFGTKGPGPREEIPTIPDMSGIPPAPRGVPQIEVTFDIDANGIVNVSAKDKATNKEQTIRIQASGGLTDEDIEQMVQDAEANSEADKKRRESVEARNNADGLIYTTEKTMSEHGESLSDEDRSEIESAIAALKAALEPEDADPADISAKTESLAQSAQKLGEALYKAQQEEAAATGDDMGDMGNPDTGGGAEADDDGATVVDADFEEVEDDPPKDKSA